MPSRPDRTRIIQAHEVRYTFGTFAEEKRSLLAGLPQVSIPAGTVSGCPAGLSFIG
jgi:hypothetical protein